MTTTLAHDILQLIDDLGLAPGDKLPPERELARHFRVSRGSIREAMKQLAAQGIVESRHGAGTFLASTPGAFSQALGAALADARHRLESLFELRLAVEPGIAALAARKATPAQVQALEQAIALQEAETDPARWGACDQAVHHALAQATGNPLVSRLVAALYAPLAETRDEGLQSPERHSASVAGHRQILQAVAAGDPGGAALAMEAHILWAHTLIQLPLKEDPS